MTHPSEFEDHSQSVERFVCFLLTHTQIVWRSCFECVTWNKVNLERFVPSEDTITLTPVVDKATLMDTVLTQSSIGQMCPNSFCFGIVSILDWDEVVWVCTLANFTVL